MKKGYIIALIISWIIILVGTVYFLTDFHNRSAGLSVCGLIFMFLIITINSHNEKHKTPDTSK